MENGGCVFGRLNNYNMYRDFDPATGRYVESDPIGLEGGVNTFAYAYGDPESWYDSLGLDGQAASDAAHRAIGTAGYSFADPSSESRGTIRSRIGGRFSYKCNKFVWDMLRAGGDPPGRMADGRIPAASEWGDPKVHIAGYVVMPPGTPTMNGDVVSDGEHVGIVDSSAACSQCTTSAAAPFAHTGPLGGVVNNNWGFRPGQQVVIRRSVKDTSGWRHGALGG